MGGAGRRQGPRVPSSEGFGGALPWQRLAGRDAGYNDALGARGSHRLEGPFPELLEKLLLALLNARHGPLGGALSEVLKRGLAFSSPSHPLLNGWVHTEGSSGLCAPGNPEGWNKDAGGEVGMGEKMGVQCGGWGCAPAPPAGRGDGRRGSLRLTVPRGQAGWRSRAGPGGVGEACVRL